MRLVLSSIVQTAKEDMTSGSSEMTAKLLQSLRSVLSSNRNLNRMEWQEFAAALKEARPGIAPFHNISAIISEIAGNMSLSDWNEAIAKKIEEVAHDEMEAAKSIAERFAQIQSSSTFLTISYSGTILAALLHQKLHGEPMVYVAESLPFGEGRMTAKKLTQQGMNVRLITDSMIGGVIDEVDCCVVGADAIIPEGVVNKVGTRALAATCMTAGKETYVLASELKIAKLDKVELGRSTKGGEGYPELSQSLEVTPMDLVDHIVTNKRDLPKSSLTWK
ncbi:MAG: Ribose 1,5-bisphosphate isomerase [Methanomassiliicoccales archaeon PtaU1.Bin124]|nr:MAG: Ribose 1,5-bisphosphate isomerase [Methanomassiliicoccales archaeon PtaU1.Bin124]